MGKLSRKSSVSEETQKGPQPLSPTPSGRLLNASTLCSHHFKAWNLLVHIFRVDGQNNRITDRSISQLRYYHSIIFGYCYDHSRYFRSKLQATTTMMMTKAFLLLVGAVAIFSIEGKTSFPLLFDFNEDHFRFLS